MTKTHSFSGATYVWVLFVLLALTLLSWGLSHVSLGAASTPVGLLIGLTKAVIVALFFMHLLHARFVLQFIILITFFFILLLTFGMVADVALRS